MRPITAAALTSSDFTRHTVGFGPALRMLGHDTSPKFPWQTVELAEQELVIAASRDPVDLFLESVRDE